MENKKVMPGIVYTDGRKKNPNEKMYLVLLKGDYIDNEVAEYRDYEWIVGRQNLYEYLRDHITNEGDDCFIIDIHKSLIISESVNILDSISVYEFMKSFKDIVNDDTGFDIEEYNIEGVGAFGSEA